MFTAATAPASVRLIETVRKHLGHVPHGVDLLAESPELLGTFLKASGAFEASTLDPIAQEVVVLTVATRNGCHLCITMHTARLEALTTQDELEADVRLEALRQFTLHLLAVTGQASDEELAAFRAAGFTNRNALEVVLGIGAYTMSTFANRLVRA